VGLLLCSFFSTSGFFVAYLKLLLINSFVIIYLFWFFLSYYFFHSGSKNHAIRKADMGARTVDTLYPTSTSNKGGIHIWNWIMTKLGLESSGKTNDEKTSEVFDSKSLYFPWHLLKSVDDTLYIIDRRWISAFITFLFKYYKFPVPSTFA